MPVVTYKDHAMQMRLVAAVCAMAGLQAVVMAQANWTQLAASGPSARYLHAMAFDSIRGTHLLFGGTSSWVLGESWIWDGASWALAATSGPPARVESALAFDTMRGRAVLFGGYDLVDWLSDTWEWDGSIWTQVAATGPSARGAHAMVHDDHHGQTVLFGGNFQVQGLNNFLNDTWLWSGSTWTQVVTAPPAARAYHAMAYDGLRHRTVLFGGYVGGNISVGDTWEWDGATWAQISTTGPIARHEAAMAFDGQRGKTVLFGGIGQGTTQVYGDTWEWNGATWTQVAATGPAARYGHAMTFDAARGQVVLFGGVVSGPIGDTWKFAALPSSTASPFGIGCGNPALTVSPAANAPPTIGTTAQATIDNIPSPLAFVALGWSRATVGPFALPFPLVGYGMPGCFLLQSAEVAAQPVTFTSPTVATYSLPLPNWSGLIGLHVYLQGWAAAPGANAGNTIVSNGLEWTIGY